MITKWKRLKETLYRHSPYRSILDVEFELPSGEHRTFALKNEGNVVASLALTNDNQVIMTRQYRPGPDQILDELPAGGIDKGESPKDAAIRELREETGYTPGEIIKLGSVIECGYSNLNRHGFLLLNCMKTGEPQLDPTEFIEVITKPIDAFIDQLMQGACSDCEIGWMGLYKAGFITKT